MSKYQHQLLHAWKLLEKNTPLREDCGALCTSACCKGDGNTGMRLLPEEVDLIRKENFIIRAGESGTFCICNGHCRREVRPFACRIFPYFPVPVRLRSGRYFIRVMPDTRALGKCPLLRNEQVQIDRRFLHALGHAGRILLKSRKSRDWLLDALDEIRITAELQLRLNKSK